MEVVTAMLAGNAVGAIAKMFVQAAHKAAEDKKTFTDKLEAASGEDVFKYILLINVSELEGYVAQTRAQAEQSFRLAKVVASVGFAILGVGITLAIYLSVIGRPTLEAAYLTAVAGVLTEFISGVFFYLYNRTLQQINLFHDKLVSMQHMSMAYLATGLVSDRTKGDQARIDLARHTVAFLNQSGTDDMT